MSVRGLVSIECNGVSGVDKELTPHPPRMRRASSSSSAHCLADFSAVGVRCLQVCGIDEASDQVLLDDLRENRLAI